MEAIIHVIFQASALVYRTPVFAAQSEGGPLCRIGECTCRTFCMHALLSLSHSSQIAFVSDKWPRADDVAVDWCSSLCIYHFQLPGSLIQCSAAS